MFELHYGIVNSLPATQTDKRRKLNRLIEQLEVLPVVSCVEVYANEKTRLRCAGTPIEDLYLIIGCTALAHQLPVVTGNTRHFARIQGLHLDDWTAPRAA